MKKIYAYHILFFITFFFGTSYGSHLAVPHAIDTNLSASQSSIHSPKSDSDNESTSTPSPINSPNPSPISPTSNNDITPVAAAASFNISTNIPIADASLSAHSYSSSKAQNKKPQTTPRKNPFKNSNRAPSPASLADSKEEVKGGTLVPNATKGEKTLLQAVKEKFNVTKDHAKTLIQNKKIYVKDAVNNDLQLIVKIKDVGIEPGTLKQNSSTQNNNGCCSSSGDNRNCCIVGGTIAVVLVGFGIITLILALKNSSSNADSNNDSTAHNTTAVHSLQNQLYGPTSHAHLAHSNFQYNNTPAFLRRMNGRRKK